ncbi:MAG TPA: DUF1015 domain-containing protein [Actinomycetota bacterium]|nr:DUF1015 domain-containing protein [Actinomycetota bacterium]
MPDLAPFRALRYAAEAGDPASLTSPPYDAITEEQRARHLGASHHNVVRLILGEDRPSDGERENRYTRAAALLRVWRGGGVLALDPEPAVYPYELSFRLDGRDRRVRGLIGAIGLEPFGRGILPHERTMAGPVTDRLRLLREVRANLSPVYAVLQGPCAPQAALLDRAAARPAVQEAVDEQGVRHRLWVETDVPADLLAAYRDETLLIADGHHRYTTALAYREEMRERLGPGPWDRMMTLSVDGATEDPPVLPIHRVVSAEPGGSALPAPGVPVASLEAALAACDDDALRIAVAAREDGTVRFRVLDLDGPAPPAVCALHERVLSRYPGAEVHYVPDASAAVAAVEAGADVAYLLPATHVERIRRVIERGERLPQKSTWFWPKPRTGMVIRPLE